MIPVFEITFVNDIFKQLDTPDILTYKFITNPIKANKPYWVNKVSLATRFQYSIDNIVLITINNIIIGYCNLSIDLDLDKSNSIINTNCAFDLNCIYMRTEERLIVPKTLYTINKFRIKGDIL